MSEFLTADCSELCLMRVRNGMSVVPAGTVRLGGLALLAVGMLGLSELYRCSAVVPSVHSMLHVGGVLPGWAGAQLSGTAPGFFGSLSD